ncbi:glycosyltransferase family 4 protein [Candidatus Marithrix sp. Canyon 246]|uniref:glycosyltransferase family 4 protein n=1 Tax=Candidatus Marithrix sp. Canyon 246 TaxID=1827136 RepID=UPI000849F113|nr:glycosyltransferase family 4 protein [Candidatus Marithrix sp. Canyon 246]
MTKLKILIVTPNYPFPENKDGVNKIIVNLIAENRYYKADVLCINGNEFHNETPPKGQKITSINHTQKKLSFVSFIYRWLFLELPFSVTKYYADLPLLAKIIEEKSKQYNVIHLATPALALLSKYLSHETIKKCILFPIDSISLFWERRYKYEFNLLKKPIYNYELLKAIKFEKKNYSAYKCIVFVSPIDVKQCRSLSIPNTTIEAIPNGVDIDYFYFSKKEPENFSMVFTGNLDYAPNKDAAFFLVNDIMPEILKIIPQAKIYLVGGGVSEKLYKFHDGKHIIITGFVDDLRVYLEKAQLYVSPLRFGSGIKNKILEALSMGKIVVGSKVSFEGIEVQHGNNCFLANIDSGKKFATSIVHIMLNNIDNNIQYNAHELVKMKYSWEAIRKLYGKLYSTYE